LCERLEQRRSVVGAQALLELVAAELARRLDHRVGKLLARMEQAARVAERAELQGEAEPVATAAAGG
jgi:hypothetical protein